MVAGSAPFDCGPLFCLFQLKGWAQQSPEMRQSVKVSTYSNISLVYNVFGFPISAARLSQYIGDRLCCLESLQRRVTRPLHRARRRVAKRNGANCLRRFGKENFVLSILSIGFNFGNRSKMRYCGDRLRLIGRDVFDLWKHSPRDTDCVPSVFAKKDFIKSFFLGRHDDRIRLVTCWQVVDGRRNLCHWRDDSTRRFKRSETYQRQYLKNSP